MIYIHKETCTHKSSYPRKEYDIQKDVLSTSIRHLLESKAYSSKLSYYVYHRTSTTNTSKTSQISLREQRDSWDALWRVASITHKEFAKKKGIFMPWCNLHKVEDWNICMR